MLITLVLMALLVILALAAMTIPDGQWSILAWVLMALTMIPIWLMLALPVVALAQAILAAGVTSWLLWRSHRDAVAGQ